MTTDQVRVDKNYLYVKNVEDREKEKKETTSMMVKETDCNSCHGGEDSYQRDKDQGSKLWRG